MAPCVHSTLAGNLPFLLAIGGMIASILLVAHYRYRQSKFNQHMEKFRRLQLRSLDAFQRGDEQWAGLLLAAAHEELDRAQYYE